MSEEKRLSANLLAREYTSLFRPEDFSLFKLTAEYHFSRTIKLTQQLKPKKKSQVVRSLINLHLGLGFDALLRSAYLYQNKCIHQLNDQGAELENLPLHQFSSIEESRMVAKSLFSLPQLAAHYHQVFEGPFTDEHQEGVKLLIMLRNREGVSPLSVPLSQEHYDLMIAVIQKIYLDAFIQKLKFELDFKNGKHSVFQYKQKKLKAIEPKSHDLPDENQ